MWYKKRGTFLSCRRPPVTEQPGQVPRAGPTTDYSPQKRPRPFCSSPLARRFPLPPARRRAPQAGQMPPFPPPLLPFPMAPPLAQLPLLAALALALALALCPSPAASHAHPPLLAPQGVPVQRLPLGRRVRPPRQPENAEPIQVLHYEIGQKYEAHFDYFHDKNNLERGGHRIATVLTYLTDVKKGGETVFPNAEGSPLQYKDEIWSECARSGPAVKPKKGDALLCFSLHVNATTDTCSLHGSCPVIEGAKWSATKWIHVRSFDNPQM